MKYNKLVRDRIPEIMKRKWEIPITHTASGEEYWQKLKEKLKEEVDEFLVDESDEEIVDILEIISAICDFKKIDKKTLETKRNKKAEERGSFKQRIILDEKK